MYKTWFKSLKRSYKERKLRSALSPATSRLECIINDRQDEIPVLVVSYNNGSYVKNMVVQLNNYGITPIIFDNFSSDFNTKQILADLERSGNAKLIACGRNYGHLVGFQEPVYKLLPEVFAYTDPDLQFSPDLPSDFLSVLAEITVQYSVYKAGLALSLTADEILSDAAIKCQTSKPFHFLKYLSIQELESQFWRMRLEHETLELYAAKIDTTFAVYRKINFRDDFFDGIRVAGNYSAIHLPWYPRLDILTESEKTRYLSGNNSTYWVRPKGAPSQKEPRS